MNHSGWNMYVFRDGRQSVSGEELIRSLTSALALWQCAPAHDSEDAVLAALIAAGQLECALLDDGDASGSCQIASEITDALAHALLTGEIHSHVSICECVERLRVGDRYEAAVQEGFAYYALHPRKVAMLLDHLALKSPIRVLGIRSIGVTLSAVACAALRQRGVLCERATVRPTGHPYDRTLEVTHGLRKWVVNDAADAEFLIVDEGPGISGSSFLAVAEALLRCGIPGERIHLIGSRAADPAALRATNAVERWARFNFHVLQAEPIAPTGAGESLSGGIWRRRFFCHENAMPASWAQLEPAKFLSIDERRLFRFEGFGHYGEAVGRRAKLLSDCGFAPQYLGNRRGFGEYVLTAGHTLQPSDCSPALLQHIAGYLALRSVRFVSSSPQTTELEKMLRWNWQVEFDEELSPTESQLRSERVVICDGRMMPHEWLRTPNGGLLKLDSGAHGDNHFFPGPCDIAWDVAGTIVEWDLHGDARHRFLHEYETRSGDRVSQRLAPYLLAYAAFCLGWSKMAAAAMRGEYDEALLERDAERYRALALLFRQEQQKHSTPEQGAIA